MVGLTGKTTTDNGANTAKFSQSLESIRHTERLETTVSYADNGSHIGHTAYPEYPLEVVETDRYWICLEGRVYDVDDLESELTRVGPWLLGGERTVELLREWLLSVDGEFVLVVCDKETGDLALCNDVMGRLPTYVYETETEFIFSRELRYVIDATEVSFDRLGVAQCLLFGYSLGERTLIENVRRLRPGTLLRVQTESLEVTETTLHTFSFDEHRHADRSRERNATELARRFVEACENRAGIYEHDIVSLSGGLDSRSVLAGYRASGCPVEAATMESQEYVPRSDVEVAEQLASDFDVDWRSYHVSHPRGSDLDTLVKLKNGQIGLMTSYILEFLRQLETRYGSATAYITGDGGDKALPDLTPSKALADEEVVDYIIEENSLLDIDTVATITCLSETAIRQSVREHVRTYPEETPAGVYTHFLIYERAVNFLFEGEDRNRLHFWSVTPFYSLPFFRYAMNCPPAQKERYKLYRAFLNELAPTAAGRTHPIYGAPVDSSRHALAAFVDDVLSRHSTLFETIKPVIKAFNDLETASTIDADTIDCMRTQIDRLEETDTVFDTDELRRFVDTDDVQEKFVIYRVFVLTSVLDDLSSRQSVLESRSETMFA